MKAPAVLEPGNLRRLRLVKQPVLVGDRRLLQLPLVDDYAVHQNNAYPVALYERDPDVPSVIDRDAAGALQLAYDELRLAGWMLHLPYATNPVSLNRGGKRGGWRADAKAAGAVRDLAYGLALHRIPNLPRIRVSLEWHVSTARTRDEDNLVKMQKHLVDGLRLAGVVHDDDRRYVLRDYPTITYRPRADGGYAHMRLFVWPVDQSV